MVIEFNEARARKQEIANMWGKSSVPTEKGVEYLPVVSTKVGVYINGNEYTLTKKVKSFCEEFVKECGNISKACEKANVSHALAKAVLYDKKKHPQAKEYIKELKNVQEKVIKKEFGYSAVQSFKKFVKAQEMSLNMKKHIVTKNGIITIKDNPDLSSYIKSEEMKGKLFGLYKNDEDSKPSTTMNIIVNGEATIGMKKIQDAIDAEVVSDDK